MSSRSTPLILAVVLSTKAVMIAFLLGGDVMNQVQLATRYTARVSFPLFLIVYSASSLLRLWPNDLTKMLVRNRRQWGLGFAFSHSVHLAALATYLIGFGHQSSVTTLFGGGAAYVLMYLMAATSNGASMKALGIWWKRLHTLGIHTLWFVFAFTYFGRLFSQEQFMTGAVAMTFALAALGLRIAAWTRARRTRAAA